MHGGPDGPPCMLIKRSREESPLLLPGALVRGLRALGLHAAQARSPAEPTCSPPPPHATRQTLRLHQPCPGITPLALARSGSKNTHTLREREEVSGSSQTAPHHEHRLVCVALHYLCLISDDWLAVAVHCCTLALSFHPSIHSLCLLILPLPLTAPHHSGFVSSLPLPRQSPFRHYE